MQFDILFISTDKRRCAEKEEEEQQQKKYYLYSLLDVPGLSPCRTIPSGRRRERESRLKPLCVYLSLFGSNLD